MTRPRTRSQLTEKQRRAERHKNYMAKYRESDVYVKRELKERVLRRVASGAVPNVKSMALYDITLEDINQLRNVNGLEPLIMNVPMFLMSREGRDIQGRNEGDYIPDQSEFVGEFIPEDEQEVEQRRREPTPQPDERPADADTQSVDDDVPLAELQAIQNKKYTGKSDYLSISIWMRSNPRQATSKRAGLISNDTLFNQYGRPNTTQSGRFYNFLNFLGDEYLADFTKVTTEAGIKHIRETIYKPSPVLKQTSRSGAFKTLDTINQEFATILVALREYPKYNATKTTNRSLNRAYQELDRLYSEVDGRIKADRLQNPKKGKPVLPWPEIIKRVNKKFPSKTSKENLYLQLYDAFPSRDDFKDLFVDASTGVVPKTKQDLESVSKNTLFLPNNTTRKSMKNAYLVLVKYKTVLLYGTRTFEFTQAITKNLMNYVEDNEVLQQGKVPYLFGKGSMSSFVKEMLNAIGVPSDREGQITYLRKSYVSTALSNIKSAEERIKLSFTMRHSPSASLIYLRKLQEEVPIEKIPDEVLDQARANRFRLDVA